MVLYKILLRDNINNKLISLLNKDKEVYLKNLSVIKRAEKDLKANIIFNGVTTDKEDLMQVGINAL